MEATLMNREIELLNVDFSPDGRIRGIISINRENQHLLPYSISSTIPEDRSDALKNWFSERCIPASRKHLSQLKLTAKVNTPLELALKANALSLSDQYWIRFHLEEQWKDLNFFHNEFSDDIGKFLVENKKLRSLNLKTPGSSLNGVMPKKWKIREGTRILVKGYTGGLNQESYREVYASMLFSQILQPSEFVMYSLLNDLSCCNNFIDSNTELVTMNSLLERDGKTVDDIDYFYLKNLYKDKQYILDWMLMMDRILLNTDRHFGNFGFIRCAITGDLLRPAPIFDTGDSLYPYVEIDYLIENFYQKGKLINPPTKEDLWPINGDWDIIYSSIPFSLYKDGLLKLLANYERLFHIAFSKFKDYNTPSQGKLWQDALLNVIKFNIEHLLSKC